MIGPPGPERLVPIGCVQLKVIEQVVKGPDRLGRLIERRVWRQNGTDSRAQDNLMVRTGRPALRLVRDKKDGVWIVGARTI